MTSIHDSPTPQGLKDGVGKADTPSTPDEDTYPGILGYFLKKNPSPQFIADVAKMNETELDPVEVKRIERKIDLLIIPALSICYMVSIFAWDS